ncbi:MAG: hypothetical protein DYG98_01500 [Haliscomenobacteraceae bacterium CHB4]|nr:hypothetical protein [Haliscomenobacteraceae bacterium CHB4]
MSWASKSRSSPPVFTPCATLPAARRPAKGSCNSAPNFRAPSPAWSILKTRRTTSANCTTSPCRSSCTTTKTPSQH